MSGNSVFIDTNIIIYLLNGEESVAKLLNEKEIYISFITELELLGNIKISKEEKIKIKEFLRVCTIIDINDSIKTFTLNIKQKHKVKLPDAIIAATAKFLNLSLITADKGFSKIN